MEGKWFRRRIHFSNQNALMAEIEEIAKQAELMDGERYVNSGRENDCLLRKWRGDLDHTASPIFLTYLFTDRIAIAFDSEETKTGETPSDREDPAESTESSTSDYDEPTPATGTKRGPKWLS